MRIWPFRKPIPKPEPLEVWPDYVDRLFRAAVAIIDSEAVISVLTEFAASVPHSTWELNTQGEVVELFKELKAAYDDILLIDTPHKAAAAAARLLKVYGGPPP